MLLDEFGFPFYSSLHREDGWWLPLADAEVHVVTPLKRTMDVGWPGIWSLHSTRGGVRGLADEAARQATARAGSIDRVLSLSERTLLPGATIRQTLGLPGDQPVQMQRFRDKVVMKRALAAAGIRVPEFAEFSAAAAAELLDRFGTVVVKPRAESGSADIRVVASPTELAGIVEWVGERAGDFEVEEFISGDLCHIDSVVADGKVVVATAGLSVSPTTAYRDLGEFIDVEIDDPLLLERLLAFNAEVIASYPGFSGVTHHEVFVCSDEIVFCEIAGRFGGGGVVPAFAAQTGISLVNAMICAQLGLPMPAVRQPRSGVTGYTLIYAPAGVLRRPVEVPDEPWVVHRRISAQPGVRRRRPTSWGQAAATITVRGRDRAEVVDRLREACSRTVIDIGPG